MAYTVTYTIPSGNQLLSLAVFVLTGANNASPLGRHAFTSSALDLSITPESTGGLVFGGIGGALSSYPYTPVSAGTTIEQQAATGTSFAMALASSAATTPVPSDYGVTTQGGEAGWQLLLMEVLPATTAVLIDASSPPVVPATGSNTLASVTSVTTASFSPPSSSLLLAVVNTGGVVVWSAANFSSSPALTWTIRQSVTGANYGGFNAIGIATAVIPAAPLATVAAGGSSIVPLLVASGVI